MSNDFFEIRQCPNCGLRYPLTANHPFGPRCPSCLGETQVVLKKAFSNFHQKRERPGKKGNFVALLDNIRSAWNVGAIFRSADGLGVRKLYLCGITPTPENESVCKTALGAEENVAWEYGPNALNQAKRLKSDGCRLIALEQDTRAIPINECQIPKSDSGYLILILGNEVTGVDPAILDLCDQIVHIPMHGQKSSLNVEVAFGIAAYTLFEIDSQVSG